ncbi:VOC family protein [Azospirillum sp. SYSU D00513]|uniref:VOC family protein n=1 Tax=Azospirillum sp. SYSU D00513 TaxID=2812561 RepID=UPI001A960B62|nr:VOC family protein [Azospirillum sp. SYSU D00513]
MSKGEDGMSTRIDHLAIAASTLEEGVEWARRALGAVPPAGGVHPRMGTHNHLMRLGGAPPGGEVYLEIIAVDPQAPPPDRPRWFALDDPAMRDRLRSGPQLVTWIARTDSIQEAAVRSPIPLGPVEPMSRGGLEWRITVPPDGALPEGGTLPALIQWPADRPHPAGGMADLGCRLLALDLWHPKPDRLSAALDAIGLERGDGLVRIHAAEGEPTLGARLATPLGTVGIGRTAMEA